MKVTKSQKVYFGLLAVGLIALGVDRFILTPAEAQAANDTSSLLIKPADSSAGIGQTPIAAVSASYLPNPVTQKLKQLTESLSSNGQITDAFTASSAWTGDQAGATFANGGANFSQTHHLSGVLLSGRAGQAMVDGKVIEIGQVIDGYKLVAVKPGMALFKAGEIQITLRIAKDQ